MLKTIRLLLVFHRLKVGLILFVVWAIASPELASAGGLKDTVKDLYGGDGILLAPPPPGGFNHAPHFQAASLQGLDDLSSKFVVHSWSPCAELQRYWIYV